MGGVYEGLEYSHNGIMDCFQPWSGHYSPNNTAVWAMAQTTQFVSVGWGILSVHGGGSGSLAAGGTYVTYVANGSGGDGHSFSIVFETLEAKVAQDVTVKLEGSLRESWKSGALSSWLTCGGNTLMVGPSPVVVSTTGEIRMNLTPACIITLTSTTGQRKGSFPLPPPYAIFPKTYSTSFEERGVGDMPYYWSDQGG